MKRTILWIAVGACALAMTLTGCNKDSIEPVIPDEGGKTPVRITARMPANPVTRLAYDESDADAVKLTWTEGDAIVVMNNRTWYTFTIDPESINNEEGTATFINTGDNIWPDGEELAGTAYYPATLAGNYGSVVEGTVSLLNQVQAVDDPKAHLGPLHYMRHYNFEGSITFATGWVSVLKFTFTGLVEGEEALQMKLTNPGIFFWDKIGGSMKSIGNMSLTFEEGTTIGPEGTLTAYIMVSPSYFNNRVLTVTLTTDSNERTYEATGVTITPGGFYEATIGDGDWTSTINPQLFDNTVAAHATGTPIAEVDGTYTITSAMELRWAQLSIMNADYGDFHNKTFLLATNIIVTADFWIPIGTSHDILPLFDGGGHTISGKLTNDPDMGVNSFGFFGYVGDSPGISNLNITAEVDGADVEYVGGIVGMLARNTPMHNCHVSGKVTGTNSVGGLAGFASTGQYDNVFDCCTYTPQPGGVENAIGNSDKEVSSCEEEHQ